MYVKRSACCSSVTMFTYFFFFSGFNGRRCKLCGWDFKGELIFGRTPTTLHQWSCFLWKLKHFSTHRFLIFKVSSKVYQDFLILMRPKLIDVHVSPLGNDSGLASSTNSHSHPLQDRTFKVSLFHLQGQTLEGFFSHSRVPAKTLQLWYNY